ncbi:MAG: 3-dehydroquinate synthase [Magnetospirillum sp. WYHS-4]
MSDLTVSSHKGPYTVHFQEDALERLTAAVPANAHFVIDRKVAGLYESRMRAVLGSTSVLLVDALEENKSLEKFPAYVQHLVGGGLRRDHELVAIGGGIVQDIVCFLAATMLRGVDWVFYPTTLLAQADSCIGSKSSINCGDAKNILGTFTPPRRIHLATAFLDTLDERDVRSGVGEMLKVHAIAGPADFDGIAADYARLFTDKETMVRTIRRALEIKRSYIEEDEFDQGPRQVFNYGHSFGHAIEAATGFAIPHGIAVTIGMDLANWIAPRLGVGTEEQWVRMRPPLKANYRGYESHPVPLEPFLKALAKDKKNVGSGSATLILPGRDGRIFKGAYPTDAAFAAFCEEFLTKVRRS